MHSKYVSSHLGWLALTIVFTVGGLSESFAQSKQYQRPKKNVANPKAKKDAGKKDSMKVDLTDIESKYWAPKDTDFSVVQSRTYTKEGRFSLSAQFGPYIRETFNTGNGYGLSLNYFPSERHGIELSYVSADLEDSQATKNFVAEVGGTGGVRPDYNRIENYYGLSYNWVPIYAKMSLLGKKILYFDMAISPGIGMMNYTKISETGDKTDSSIAFSLDITQYFFLSKHLAIRADLKNSWYTESRIDYQTGAEITDQSTNTSVILLGITYYH